jgi:hypothetical protein
MSVTYISGYTIEEPLYRNNLKNRFLSRAQAADKLKIASGIVLD